MILGWQYPEPIRELMSNLGAGKYAHLELVPMTTDGMSSRWSPPLYKWLAFEASQRKWVPGKANTFELRIEPGRLVAEIDFPEDGNGKFNIGKLSKFATETFIKDMKNVLKFSVTVKPDYEAVRGRKISAYVFTITVNPPSLHNVRVRYDKTQFRRGGKDDPVIRSGQTSGSKQAKPSVLKGLQCTAWCIGKSWSYGWWRSKKPSTTRP